MTLTEFVSARLAEDKAELDAGDMYAGLDSDGWMGYAAGWDRGRAVAEVASKRAILDEHSSLVGGELRDGCMVCYQDPEALDGPTYPCPTLRHLADPYAGHPDYDQSWKA